MAKVRIVIEYEFDSDQPPTQEDIDKERKDWLEGNISVADVVATDGFFSLNILEVIWDDPNT